MGATHTNPLKWLKLGLPLIPTAFLLAWTAAVSPYSKYGDDWAVLPALWTFPVAIVLHGYLVAVMRPRGDLLGYALAHLVVLFPIWLICVMKLAKDSF